jgi:hypothetical protein
MAKTLQVKADIIADTASYVAGVKRATAATDKFGRATKKAGSNNAFRNIGRSAVAATAGVVSLYGAYSQGKKAIDATTKLAKGTLQLQRVTNMSTRDASRFAAVLQERGIEANKASVSFTALSKQIVAAQGGTAKAADAFKKLGVSQELIKKGDTQAVLLKAADGLSKMGAGANRTALAAQLFGKGYKDLLPLLLMGSKGISEQTALAGKLGAEFSGSGLKSAKDFIKGQREMKTTTLGLQVALGTALMPTITSAMKEVTKFVLQFRDGTGRGGEFKDTLKSIYDTLKPIVTFLIDHPRVVAGAAAAYIAFKATLAGLNLFNTLMTSFGSVQAFAAAGGIRGRAFAVALGVGLVVGIPLALAGVADMISQRLIPKNMGSQMQGAFGFTGGISERFGKWWAHLKGLASAGWSFLKKLFAGKGSGGTMGFIQAPSFKGLPKIISSVRSTMSSALHAVTSKAGAFISAGGELVAGLASGIRRAAGLAIQAAKDLASSLPSWVKKVLGINSPSRVFAEIGAGLVEGMAAGMSRTAPLVKAAAKMVKAATPSGGVRAATGFGLGGEVGNTEALQAARRAVTNARNKKARDKAAKALSALEAKQAAKQARATAGETLKGFIEGIKDQIKTSRIAAIMGGLNKFGINVDKARADRAQRETDAARGGLGSAISRAQAEAADPRVQARYQRDAARLDARMVQARKSGNLEAIDALQSEKDALDARYGPAYLAGLQDQLNQLNENEIEASSEAAATAFAATFATGMQAALDALLAGGTVQAFFAQLTAAMTGSGVSPGALPPSVTAGAGEAAASVAPAPLGSRITAYLRGKDKKKTYTASAIAAGLSPKSTKSAVYKYTGKEFGGYKIANRASGGMLTPGMLTMVGETGPELIMGGKVSSATRTNRMGGAQGMNITVNAVGAAADDPMLLARQLGWQLATR